MADGSVTIETKLDDSGAKKGIGTLNSILGKVGSGITSAFKVGATAIAGVSTAIAGAIGYGAKYNATIEQYATSFEVMTGSVEKATEVTEKLKKIGAETPFEMTDLADTTQLLMNYGFTADDAISKMQMLGDISQGSADKMNRIAMAYGQMSSAGKVQLEDVKQMIEAGFNPLQEISESTGESMESLYNRISKGTISVDEITASMERSTSAGGKYFQSMQKQSQTVSGQLSTLKDNASQLLGTLTEGFSSSLAGTILPMLNEMTGSLQQAFETGGIEAFSVKLGEVLSTLLTNLANSLPNLVNIGTNILQNLILGIQTNLPQLAQSAISIVTSLLNFLLTNMPLLINMGMQFILQLIVGLGQALPQLIPQAVNAVITLVNGLIDNLPALIDAGIQLLLGVVTGIVEALPQLIDAIPQIITKLVETLTKPDMLGKIIEGAIKLMVALAAGLIQAIPQILGAIPQIISSIGEAFRDYDWGALGQSLLQGLLNGFSNAGNIIWSAIKKVGSSMIDGIKSFFGIHSPSRVFADLGEYLPQGFAVGINRDATVAVKSVKKMNKSILKGFNFDGLYSKMQNAVNLETGKIATSLSTTATTNKTLTANITVNPSDIYMDSTKVGRAVAPAVTKTIKGGGAY